MAKVTREERAAITRATRVAADTYQVFRPLLFLPRGGKNIETARQIAQYLACVSGNVKMSRVAVVFGRHMTTITHNIAKIEDMRDDPEFDHFIDTLEHKFNET